MSEEQVDLLAGLKTGRWLDNQHFPPLRWVVHGLIPEGLTLLVGGPKIGKSWLSLDIGLAGASGGCAVGAIPVEKRPVLLLALEDGDRRLQSRARQLLGPDPIPDGLDYMTQVIPGTAKATIETWLASLPNISPPPLVILDTLGKVMPPSRPGESDYQRDYRVAGALKAVADSWPGMALVALHHDRKAAAEDFVGTVSGTNGIAGAADTVVVLNRRRTENTGRFLVTGRDVTENEYAVAMDGCRWTLAGNSLASAAQAAEEDRATAGLGDRSADVLRFVGQHPEGVRAAEVAIGLSLDREQVKVYLVRLLDAGKVTRPSRGLYKPLVTPVTSVTFPDSEISESNTSNGTNRGTEGYPDPESNEPAVASRLHTNSVNGSNGTNGSNGRYPNSSEGSQSNRSNRSKCSDRSDEPDHPADPCPNCGYSLTLRAGTQRCAWRHKQAQAKKEAGR